MFDIYVFASFCFAGVQRFVDSTLNVVVMWDLR